MLFVKTRLFQIGVLLVTLSVSCDDDSSQKANTDSGIDENQDTGVITPNLSGIYFRSATELSKMIREGEITSVELLELFLKRIERYNGEINAVVAMDIQAARARAEQADEALARGENWGPLHGVPITIKDNYEVVGMPTTSGDVAYKDYMSTKNAVAVQRLIDAGAIVFGKTNLPYRGMDWQSYNDVYGTTNNPWDLSRTPGGSSGGAAAALATGFTALELGNDIGGSLRIPSHFCGIYGLKTSFGMIPRLGTMPNLPSTMPAAIEKIVPLFVAGPLARSAEDLDLALEVLTTPSKSEQDQETIELLPPRHKNFKDYRVAVWLTDPTPVTVVDDEEMAVLSDVVNKLRNAGLTPDENAHPDINRIDDIYIWSATMAQMSTGQAPLTNELATKRDEHRATWEAFFKDYDVLLAPVSPTTAFPHQFGPISDRPLDINHRSASYMNNVSWATLAIVAGLPVTVAPIGLSASGLPVGVQIIGAPFEDRTTIDFARGLAQITGGFQPPPDYDDDDTTSGRNAESTGPDEIPRTDGLLFEEWVVKDVGNVFFDPFPGVTACVHEHPEIACATTDEQGYYALSHLPKNSELVITLAADGYVPTAHAIATQETNLVMFPLSSNISYAYGLAFLGQTEPALAILNQTEDMPNFNHAFDRLDENIPEATVEIDRDLGAIWFRANVLTGDERSAPLSDVSVTIEPEEGDGPFYRGNHSEGYFYNLPAGEYLLTFSHPDYNCDIEWPLRGFAAERKNTIRVPVLEGFQTDPVGVLCKAKADSETNAVSTGVTISGKVVEFSPGVGPRGCEEPTEETPIEGFEICIFENDEIPCVFSGPDGKFELGGLPDGAEVLVSYTKEGYPSYLRAADLISGYVQMSRLKNDEQIARDDERIGVTFLEQTKGQVSFSAFTYNTDNLDSPYAFTCPTGSYVFLDGVSISLEPHEGIGPYYANNQEQLDPSLDATSEVGWGSIRNVDPGEYDLVFTHPTMNCMNIGPEYSRRIRVVAGFVTYAANALCF